VSNDRDNALLSHFWCLHAAVIKRDGLEQRLRFGEQDEELFDRSLSAAQDVLAARSALYRYLICRGWTPPDETVKDLEYDEFVLSQRDGALRG